MTKKRIVVLISGRGSNMQVIAQKLSPKAKIVGVLSNRPAAEGLVWARAQGIATQVIDHQNFADRIHFDQAMMAAIDALQPDLVVLAGFMRILSPAFTEHYEGRLLNIHPSLLPAFTGLHTHQRAIDMGCKVAGCTVHFVTAELDHGPIVMQAVVPVLPNDQAETLAARVLKMEHQIYPAAVNAIVDEQLSLIDGNVQVKLGCQISLCHFYQDRCESD